MRIVILLPIMILHEVIFNRARALKDMRKEPYWYEIGGNTPIRAKKDCEGYVVCDMDDN